MAARPVSVGDRAPTVRADDECAALYRRHGGEILRYCQAKLRERADAEDVAQQVFVRAYGALLRGERVRLPRHWLLRIARNECRRFAARRHRVQEVGFDEALDVPPTEEQPRWSPAEIRRALDELVPAQRAALVLRELEGRSYAEIARELRVTVSAVETLLFRARRSLREQLDGSLACDAAERALSLELDGRLPRKEQPGLRAHLRACGDCRRLARRHRARRHALRTLLPLPLHGSLTSLLGGGAATGGVAAGTGAVVKAITLLAAGAVSTGLGIAAARTAPVAEAAHPAAAGLAASASGPTRAGARTPTPVPPAAASVTTRAAATPAAAPAAAPAEAVRDSEPEPAPPAKAPAPSPASSSAAPAGGEAPSPGGEDAPLAIVSALPVPVATPELPPVEPPTLPLEPPSLPPAPSVPPEPPEPPPLEPPLLEPPPLLLG